MSKIHSLPPSIVAKIAAGEVIERPAYAVKELIENAIDAGADEIAIYVENAGLKKIIVSDNGEGMDEKDLKESYKPHTTSKTGIEDELVGIKTLGFRGEALASLAAVSKLTIKSRTKKETLGNQIEVIHGNLLKSLPVGIPRGTVVSSENLFSDIPARKKFLKSPQTELRYITEIISHYALAYPPIHLSFTHNKRLIFDFSKNQTQEERIYKIIGKNTTNFLFPITHEENFITIRGFLAHPQFHSSSTSKQFLFINKRKVHDKLISLAIREAYGTLLDSSSYPSFVLNITIPYEMVDVNIHPRKETIGLVNNQTVFQTIKQAVQTTLNEQNITFQNLSWKTGVSMTQSFAGKLLKETVLDKEVLKTQQSTTVIQMHNLYIFYSTKNGFVFIDQHAAHERILFEKLSKEFLKQKKKQKLFQLNSPIVLHLSPSETLLLKEQGKLFKKLGFVVSTVSHVPILSHIPYLFQDRNPHELVKSILDELNEDVPPKQVDKVSEEMLSFLACRAAVKAGDTLTETEMKKIIDDLSKTPNNTTCPHGRPTYVFTSLSDFNRNFKR